MAKKRRTAKRRSGRKVPKRRTAGRKKVARRRSTTAQALRGVKRTRVRRIPLWSIDHGITYSALSTFEQCPEQFGLKYIDGLSPKAISEPLEFGNIIHFALQHQFKFSSPQETIHTITNQYRAWRAKTLLNPGEHDKLLFLCALADVTFPAYCDYWHADDKKIDWIGREEKFDVPYIVETGEGPIEIRLRGMRDGLARFTPRKIGVFETKTKSQIKEQEIRDGLRSDMQTLFYCAVTEIETGETPSTVKYNIIRRAKTYRRQKGMEPLPKLMKRIAEDIEARPEFYFMRYTVDLLPRDIADFRRETLDPLLRRFLHWHDHVKKNPSGRDRFKSPYHYRSCAALHSKYGKADMWEAIVNRNFRPYRIRTDVFPELEDSFLVT